MADLGRVWLRRLCFRLRVRFKSAPPSLSFWGQQLRRHVPRETAEVHELNETTGAHSRALLTSGPLTKTSHTAKPNSSGTGKFTPPMAGVGLEIC